jgi:glycosyltransferase involved in cell wall biosynthesis
MIDLFKEGRILYVSSIDVSIGDGPGVNEREFIIALHELLGDRVNFLIPQPRNLVSDLPVDRCWFCVSHNRRHPLSFWRHVASQISQANALLKNRKYDLLVFRLGILPIVQRYITRNYRIPYVIKTLGQGPIKVFDKKGGLVGKALRRPNLQMFQNIVSKSQVADACSLLHVEYLQEILGVPKDHVVWIDNAVNTKRFFPTSTSEARSTLNLTQFNPIIGYVGTRPWERGGMQIIEAAPKLLPKYPNLGLVILGDGKELEPMKARATELEIRDHCRFEGYVPFHQIPLYVNSLDLGVSISLQDERRFSAELKVRQYLACGKPVIVGPGSNEFVLAEKFGSYVESTNIDSIANEADKWLSLTKTEKEIFASRSYRYMQTHLSMEAMVKKRISLWNDRLNRNYFLAHEKMRQVELGAPQQRQTM